MVVNGFSTRDKSTNIVGFGGPFLIRMIITLLSIKNGMGPNPNGPRLVSCDRAIRYSGLGVLSVGPVGDFLDFNIKFDLFPPIWAPLNDLWEIHQQKSAKNWHVSGGWWWFLPHYLHRPTHISLLHGLMWATWTKLWHNILWNTGIVLYRSL